MISRTIEWCARNRFLVFTGVAFCSRSRECGALRHVPLDALPDISDVQVIIHTEWAGEPPNVIEDQVTYPIVSALLVGASREECTCADHVWRFLRFCRLSGWHRPLLGALARDRIPAADCRQAACRRASGDRARCYRRGMGV